MKIRFFFIYILALVLIMVITFFLLLSMARVAHAAETVYYCKGSAPWLYDLQDFKVWVEQPCHWLPLIVR